MIVVPLLVLHAQQQVVARDAGVVDEDRDRRRAAFWIAASAASICGGVVHVEHDARARRCPRRASAAAIAVGARLGRRGADHRRAGARERERDRAADAARGAGDQRDSALRARSPAAPPQRRRDRDAGSRQRERLRARRRCACVEARQHLARPAFDDVASRPAARSRCTISTQRTGLPPAAPARRGSRRDRRSLATSTLLTTGIAALRTRRCARHSREPLGRGLQQRAVERRAHRQHHARASRLRAFAAAAARSTAALWPAITTWPGALKFTASTTSPCAASRAGRAHRVVVAARGSPPSRRARAAPPPASPARESAPAAPRRETRARRRRPAPCIRRGCARRRTPAAGRPRPATRATPRRPRSASPAAC